MVAGGRGSVNYIKVIRRCPVAIRMMHCGTCDAVRPFDEVPCADDGDDHDGDCQEWLCTACGEALVGAPLTVLAVQVRTRGGGAAPRQRRAA